jgi:hypothetical protein
MQPQPAVVPEAIPTVKETEGSLTFPVEEG